MTQKDLHHSIFSIINDVFPHSTDYDSGGAAKDATLMIVEMLLNSSLNLSLDPSPPETSLFFWQDSQSKIYYSIQGSLDCPVLWRWNKEDRLWIIPAISAVDFAGVLRCLVINGSKDSNL